MLIHGISHSMEIDIWRFLKSLQVSPNHPVVMDDHDSKYWNQKGALGILPMKKLKKPAWCDNEEQSIWKYCNNISCIWVTNDNSELNMSENHISRLGDHDMINLAIMS